jgi:mercuric ion transport protein
MVIVVFFAHMVQFRVRLYSRKIVVNRQELKVMWQKILTKNTNLGWFTLLVTSGTLLCCALPILMVSLGFGAVVASLNYNIPGLLFLAEHKFWTLSLSALILFFLAWVIWRPSQNCSAEPELATQCQKAKRLNQHIFWLSIGIWCIGFFFSVLVLPLRQLFST